MDYLCDHILVRLIISHYSGGPIDLIVKMAKIPAVIKGRFYVTTSLSDSWKDFTPLCAGVTLERFLH